MCSISEYLMTDQPDLIWAHSDTCVFSSLLGRKKVSAKVPIAFSIHNEPSYGGKKRPYLNYLTRECDGIHAVSKNVALSFLNQVTGTTAVERKIFPIYNPFDTARILSLAKLSTAHEWLELGKFFGESPKVVVAAGHLSSKKNFELLVKAFPRVLQSVDAKLIILGEGKERESLEYLIQELQIGHAVSMPGWVENPYSYMAKAHLFVMSSCTEGFGRVLVEALICGCPIVSTDCPSGPREVLENGQWGRLVPIDNEVALANAIIESLNEDVNYSALRKRGMSFDTGSLIRCYEAIILDTVNKYRTKLLS